MLRKFSSFKLPKLPFPDTSLEPIYDKKTLDFHWGKHHQVYVDNLNKAIGDRKVPLLEVIQDLSQHSLPFRNMGGGHYNHCLFWLSLGKSASKPSGNLLAHIEKDFGDFDSFKAKFNQAAIATFGSGWAFLNVNPEGRLIITSCPNQDNLLMKGVYKANAIPFFTVDVWEHAYYLQYQNRRAEFVDKFWSVVNWDKVQEMYENYAIKQVPVPVDRLLE